MICFFMALTPHDALSHSKLYAHAAAAGSPPHNPVSRQPRWQSDEVEHVLPSGNKDVQLLLRPQNSKGLVTQSSSVAQAVGTSPGDGAGAIGTAVPSCSIPHQFAQQRLTHVQ